MEATDLMSDVVFVASPTDSVSRVRNLFMKHKISVVPVVEKGKVVGMVGERDLSDALYHIHEPIDTVDVSKVMSKAVAVAGPSTPPERLAKMMKDKNTNAVTIFDPDSREVVGIVTKTDLTRHFSKNYHGKASVADLMSRKVRTIGRFHSIFRAAREMEDSNIGRLVVLDGGVVGILTARDLALATYGLRPEKLVFASSKGTRRSVQFRPLIVDDLMRQELYTIPSKSDAASAAKLMLEKKVGSVVVVDRGELRGIITKTDVINYLASSL